MKSKTVDRLKEENEELKKELMIMDKANYRCNQRCLGYIEEIDKLKKELKKKT